MGLSNCFDLVENRPLRLRNCYLFKAPSSCFPLRTDPHRRFPPVCRVPGAAPVLFPVIVTPIYTHRVSSFQAVGRLSQPSDHDDGKPGDDEGKPYTGLPGPHNYEKTILKRVCGKPGQICERELPGRPDLPMQRCCFKRTSSPQKFARNQGKISQFRLPNDVKSLMRRSPASRLFSEVYAKCMSYVGTCLYWQE
jgi:hypothetical protein